MSASGDDISWIAIEAYGTFDSGTHPTQMREQYDWWEAFMAETNTDAPEGVTAGWQTHGATVLMDTLLNLVVSGVYATVLSCGLALCVSWWGRATSGWGCSPSSASSPSSSPCWARR